MDMAAVFLCNDDMDQLGVPGPALGGYPSLNHRATSAAA